MSVKPTTRLGYRNSARPHRWRSRVPGERLQAATSRSFNTQRPFRMAGSRGRITEAGFLDAPQGIGPGRTMPSGQEWETFPSDWESFPNDWETFPADWDVGGAVSEREMEEWGLI